jgi:hypothetical protein
MALAACLTIATATPAASSTPTLMWSGAKRVNILCNVAGGPGIDHVSLTRLLCADVQRLASKGSPLPVATIPLGDPAVLASDSVTLLVHASVTDHKQGPLLAFSIRPYRTSSDQTAVLFGAPPRVATISTSGVSSPSLDAALEAALSDTLPWQDRPPMAQPIERRN